MNTTKRFEQVVRLSTGTTIGSTLRDKVISNVSSILDESNGISDSMNRLAIQGTCLDMLVELEQVIDELNLDN